MYYAKRERESDNVDQGENMHMGKKRDRKRESRFTPSLTATMFCRFCGRKRDGERGKVWVTSRANAAGGAGADYKRSRIVSTITAGSFWSKRASAKRDKMWGE